MKALGYFLGFCLLLPIPSVGQERPLRTADPRLIAPGGVMAEVGFEVLQDAEFPLSGLAGDLVRVGNLRVRFGVSPRVEIQLAGTVQNFLDIEVQQPSIVTPALAPGETSTNDFGDLSLATKILLLKEQASRPAVSFLWAVELPNSNERKGIGTNTTNFFASVLAGNSYGRMRLWGNVGIGILESPAETFDQNDVLTYGGAALYQVHQKRNVNFVAEVQGRANTRGLPAMGTESRSQARYGLQWFWRGVRWDVAGVAGLTRYDPSHGVSFGVTFGRKAFAGRASTSAMSTE